MSNKSGTLWVVKKDMPAYPNSKNNEIGDRQVIIKKGEIIEWRYFSQNHFRTLDDKWFVVDDDIFDTHCLKIAIIDNKILSFNKAKTLDIWRLNLFEFVENGEEILSNIKEADSNDWN
jgi:hypothetical protein